MPVKEFAPVSLRLPQPLNEALDLACKIRDRSKSELIREYIAAGLIRDADTEAIRLEIEQRHAANLESARRIKENVGQGAVGAEDR